MSQYDRRNLAYEKPQLLIDGPGKYPGYNFYWGAGKDKGEAEGEAPPVEIRSLLP